ncbi:hypothetical protein, partial [Arenibaculum sp.]|uniref:hypothetical protein n=1 Tax=Arenibaculum sp. TaxID=2865862 RepID=UPI002E110494|nr:hypothetical protein [Arenibaculum sp.]
RKRDWEKETMAAIRAALPQLPIPRRNAVPPPADNGDPAVAWFREWHHWCLRTERLWAQRTERVDERNYDSILEAAFRRSSMAADALAATPATTVTGAFCKLCAFAFWSLNQGDEPPGEDVLAVSALLDLDRLVRGAEDAPRA